MRDACKTNRGMVEKEEQQAKAEERGSVGVCVVLLNVVE